MITPQTIIFALLGGILPALVWMWFWQREDACAPEPRRLILLSFIAGILSIPFVILAEKFTEHFYMGTTIVIVWASIEEIFKYLAAYFALLWRREVDEPMDGVIYMISVALGFAAIENALFLIDPLAHSGFVTSLVTGNFRFLGAMVLHTLASGTIGIAMALAFYRGKVVKRLFLLGGIILAITLHSIFNLLIINSTEHNVLFIFMGVWAGVIILLLILEKIKKMRRGGCEF
jgi:RsiW-degrading membrane proteinase PrsW (M82 family)